MSLTLKTSVALSLVLLIVPMFAQTAAAPPNYDSKTETKTKGVIEEIKTLTVGKRTDYTEAIVKSGDDKIEIYLSPKPFQDEMGINFAKGDEISVTGSRVKQEGDKQEPTSVILAREIVKGTDTLMFRDDKGKPVWDERTGK
jgi:hypothetical protein